MPQADRTGGYDAWVDELRKLGRRPDEFRVGLIKSWFLSDQGRDDPLWQVVRERERYRGATYAPWLAAGYVRPAQGAVPIDQSYMLGSPSELIEQIDSMTKSLPLTDIIGWATPPGMNPEEMNPRLERFAREVMPHFR